MPHTHRRGHPPFPPSPARARQSELAQDALKIGTALAFGGVAVLVGLGCVILDVWSLDDFKARMRARLAGVVPALYARTEPLRRKITKYTRKNGDESDEAVDLFGEEAAQPAVLNPEVAPESGPIARA